MLLEAIQSTRDLGRLHEIAAVLIRHGFGDAVRRLGLARWLESAGRVVHWSGARDFGKDPQVHVREAFEELGPTFVKVGQLLAGRSDLLPPAWTEELARLHERARPVPYEELRSQLVADLGGEPEAVFRSFDREPLAAASIAQVHRATLQDGTAVVVKLRRPGIREVVEADLRLLTRLAEHAEDGLPELRRYRPRHIIRQFARSLRNELDMRIEARNAERLRANLPPDSKLVIPRIHEQWTRESTCVMDFLPGPSLGAWIRSGRAQELDVARVELGAESVLHSIFVDGLFHADPHPGNVILLPDGRLGLVDFGMVGFLSEERRLEFLDLLVSISSRDVDAVVSTLLDWGQGDVEPDLLKQDCAAFIDRYHGLPLRDLDATALIADLMALLRENDLFLPHDLALLLKVFVTLDGMGRQLDPGFVMSARIEPFARAAWREERSPAALVRRGSRELRGLLAALPRDLRRLASSARRGRLRVEVDVEQLVRVSRHLDRGANRLTLGLITSALILGTAISLLVPMGPRVAGLPLFGFLGFASSIAAGFWLLWSIARSNRD